MATASWVDLASGHAFFICSTLVLSCLSGSLWAFCQSAAFGSSAPSPSCWSIFLTASRAGRAGRVPQADDARQDGRRRLAGVQVLDDRLQRRRPLLPPGPGDERRPDRLADEPVHLRRPAAEDALAGV